MVIIWQKQAKQDLKEYSAHSKISKIKEYISELVNYVDLLSSSPELGKTFLNINGTELRQLIFRMHRIFYFINNEKIVIAKVVHTSRNIDNVILYFKQELK